jgi:stringent starvation protein B
MKLLCLADEGSNSLRFSNSKVKSHHRFYGFYRLSQIKIRNISVIRGKKNHQVVLLRKEATYCIKAL